MSIPETNFGESGVPLPEGLDPGASGTDGVAATQAAPGPPGTGGLTSSENLANSAYTDQESLMAEYLQDAAGEFAQEQSPNPSPPENPQAPQNSEPEPENDPAATEPEAKGLPSRFRVKAANPLDAVAITIYQSAASAGSPISMEAALASAKTALGQSAQPEPDTEPEPEPSPARDFDAEIAAVRDDLRKANADFDTDKATDLQDKLADLRAEKRAEATVATILARQAAEKAAAEQAAAKASTDAEWHRLVAEVPAFNNPDSDESILLDGYLSRGMSLTEAAGKIHRPQAPRQVQNAPWQPPPVVRPSAGTGGSSVPQNQNFGQGQSLSWVDMLPHLPGE